MYAIEALTSTASGFRATTPEEFAAGFAKALEMSDEEAFAMRLRARESSWRFSEQVFTEAWTKQLEALVGLTESQGQKHR